jgi:hypothetical protein
LAPGATVWRAGHGENRFCTDTANARERAGGRAQLASRAKGDIRKNIIEADLVDRIVALPGQLFYTSQILVRHGRAPDVRIPIMPGAGIHP